MATTIATMNAATIPPAMPPIAAFDRPCVPFNCQQSYDSAGITDGELDVLAGPSVNAL